MKWFKKLNGLKIHFILPIWPVLLFLANSLYFTHMPVREKTYPKLTHFRSKRIKFATSKKDWTEKFSERERNNEYQCRKYNL